MKRLLFTLGLALALHAPALHAQIKDPLENESDADVTRLQIPVLAFTGRLYDQKPIPPGVTLPFLVAVDGGPPSPVQHVRLEDADPISLSIVLDLSGDQKRIVSTISTTIASFVSQSLHPPDYVSIYAVDCSVVQTADDVRADGAAIERAVNEAMQSTAVHQPEKDHHACMGHGEALARITDQLSQLYGRRVILAVGPRVLYGHPYPDFDRNINDPSLWTALGRQLDTSSVTVFGFKEGDPDSTHLPDVFSRLCQKSGGIVLSANQKDVASQLQYFIDLVRGRYILEFDRPSSERPHHFAVSLAHTKNPYFIYPGGFTLPIGDSPNSADVPDIH
jgi:hypothetical protein